MHTVTQFVHTYPWASAAALWLFSAATHAMPDPKPEDRYYAWLYNFLHVVAANLDRIGKTKP